MCEMGIVCFQTKRLTMDKTVYEQCMHWEIRRRQTKTIPTTKYNKIHILILMVLNFNVI